MPTNTDIAKRIWDFFSQPTAPLREQFLQKAEASGERSIQFFSDFDAAHLARVNSIWKTFENDLRTATDDEAGMNAVMDRAESLIGHENPDLLFYALNIFLTRYRGDVRFSIPSLVVREPELITPSALSEEVRPEVAVGSAEETMLDWFREAPSINEHHEHWHTVYPSFGVELDRQGEMFFYMHRQMIARYDAERIADEVARVVAYDDFSKPIAVGYAAGPDERLSGFIRSMRPPGTTLAQNVVQNQARLLRAIQTDIDNGHYDLQGNNMVDETNAANRLGSTIESNEHSQADVTRNYIGYHGWGHVRIAELNVGVMRTTVTAVRDVVFWEWHKGIDEISFRWQERLPAYNFETDAPQVSLRKERDAANERYSRDLILCFTKDIPGADAEGFDGSALGNAAFGGDHWDTDFGKGTFSFRDGNGQEQEIRTVDTLRTSFREGRIRYRSLNGQPREYLYRYLVHEPFCYFIRVKNNSLEQKDVTVRIFIVPAEHENDRTMWIEMDKFLHTLAPESESVIFRKDVESSVVKKPAVLDPGTANIDFNPRDIEQNDRACDCGWPYQMLLPRGKRQSGMKFRLMVMLTDASIDMIEQEDNCGSFSFCAARADAYPDKRPLGYPFNRKFSGNGQGLMNTLSGLDNVAFRTITIKNC